MPRNGSRQRRDVTASSPARRAIALDFSVDNV
jgi:hypothetical protein